MWYECEEYEYIVTKVGYMNMVAVYHIKIKQYSYVFEIFNQILYIYNSRPIDCTN